MEWTQEQLEFLKDNYSYKGKQWCMKEMGLKECQVRYMASQLGLKIDLQSAKKYYKKRVGYFKGKKRPEHSAFMKQLTLDGKNKAFNKRSREKYIFNCIVCNKEIVYIIPKDSKQKYRLRKTCSDICYGKSLSNASIELHKKHGHPRGMLGKKHTPEFKKEMSIRSKKMWADKNNYLNSEEYKQLVSDRSVSLHKKGLLNNNNTYSNCKKSWFIDGTKKHFMRSGWELRYAAFLNILKKGKAINDWDYEVDTFWFDKIKRGVRSYKPDFKIFNNDGSIEYHEVKGRMDEKSKTKLKRMKKYYPDIVIKIKGAEFFKLNKNIIPSYENSFKKYSNNGNI